MKFSKDEFIKRYKTEYGKTPTDNLVAIAECIAELYEQGYDKEVKAFVAGMKN